MLSRMVLVYMTIIPFSNSFQSSLLTYIRLGHFNKEKIATLQCIPLKKIWAQRSYSNLSVVCLVFGYSWHLCDYCTTWISSCSTDMVLRSWGCYYLPPPSQSPLYIPRSPPSQSFRITGQLITPNMFIYSALAQWLHTTHCTLHLKHIALNTTTHCPMHFSISWTGEMLVEWFWKPTLRGRIGQA